MIALSFAPSTIMYILLGIFSLCIGSLLNVIIYRLPLMLGENEQKINLFLPRSYCPHCKTPIPIWHNIPLLSFLLLRGQCRQCSHNISIRYPLVEVFCVNLSLFSAYFFGFNSILLFVLLFIWIIICITAIDLEHQLIPDGLSLTLLWLGLIANTQGYFTTLPNAVLSAVGGYLFLWLFIRLYYLLTGKIGMGNGDFKLFAAFGAWFGWTALPLILLIASVFGTIIGLTYLFLTRQTRDTTIPFGPFLCLAGIFWLFAGKDFLVFT